MGASASFPEKSFYEFKSVDVQGNELDFASFKGKVVLLMNSASF